MGVDEGRAADNEFPSLLWRYHESLLADPADGSHPELPADADPDLSARLKRVQECVQLLHSAWADDKSDGRSRQSSARERALPQSSFQPGEPATCVGRYEIVRELGRGAFGIVFLAFDLVLGREVALKLPRPEAIGTSRLSRRFFREAQAAAALSHPNLVSVFECGQWGPVCYIATEYCAGPTLAAWLHLRAEPVPLAAAARLVATLAAALDYAHNQGIIHRDLKPSNVMLVPKRGGDSLPASGENEGLEFVPKITDFGLAKLLESGPDETRSGAILGTPAYMAPEQAEGRLAEVGRPTDVHALGAILYEMLTGRPPFSGATDVETLKRVALDEPTPLRRLRAGIPRSGGDLPQVPREAAALALSHRPRPGGRLGAVSRGTTHASAAAGTISPLAAVGPAPTCGHRVIGDHRADRPVGVGRPSMAGRKPAKNAGHQRQHSRPGSRPAAGRVG